MKIIVTGGAGFIGSNLTEFLVKIGYKVIILDNFSSGNYDTLKHLKDDLEIIDCDISVQGEWMSYLADCDYAVHLAALADIVPSIREPARYFATNVTGTLNLIEGLRETKVRKMIYAASSSCYGIPKDFPTSEASDTSPQYPYALTKLMGEQLVEHWAKLYRVPAVSLRFFNVYGPRARTSGSYGAVLGVFLAQKLANKPLTIVGNGKQTRDFTYISDVIAAIYAAMQSELRGYRFYNVGSGNTVSVNTLASLIGGTSINIPKRPGEPDCTFADITKIKEELQWKPKVTIERGMTLLQDYDQCWDSAPVWDEASIAEATQDWFKYLG